jgi:NOL1/NOP2/sun family putative RNA methylase
MVGDAMDFKEHFIQQLGEDKYRAFESVLKSKAISGIIINPKKSSITQIKQIFANFKNHPLVRDALIIERDFKLGNHPLFHSGAFYIQDPSAMMVIDLLKIDKNDKVIDLAAAPGGKSFQAATKLGEGGLLVANDVSYTRAKTLSSNIEKYGFKNVIVTANEPSMFNKYHQGYFDKVILDAPCSGEGMFRKDPFALKDWSLKKVLNCAVNQKQLILDGYKLLKKGGIMVYSTCTFTLEENETIIEYLLNNTTAELVAIYDNPMFDRGIKLKEAVRIYPFNFPGEGHFIALIKSHDDYDYVENNVKPQKLLDSVSVNNFLIKHTNLNLDTSRLILNQDQVYLVPTSPFNYSFYHCLRIGWQLGMIKDANFIPGHSLAMASSIKDFKLVLNLKLDDQRLKTYLSGNILKDQLKDGYYLIAVDNISLGLAKVSNNQFKNYYPKGLRLK